MKQLVNSRVRDMWRQKGETWMWAEADTVVDAWSSSTTPHRHLWAQYLQKGDCSSLFFLQHLIPFLSESVFSLMPCKGDQIRLHLLMRSVRRSSKRSTKPWCVNINRDAVLTWCCNSRKHFASLSYPSSSCFQLVPSPFCFSSQKQVLVTSFFQHCLQRGDHS